MVGYYTIHKLTLDLQLIKLLGLCMTNKLTFTFTFTPLTLES